MKNTLKLNHADRTIVMDKTFAKFALDTRTDEYKHLQEVRRDYPNQYVLSPFALIIWSFETKGQNKQHRACHIYSMLL